MKKIFILSVISLLIGFGITKVIGLGNPKNNSSNIPLAVSVSSRTLQLASINISEEFPGRIVPYLIAEIRPQVGGIIIDRSFIEGSNIKKGQQLYQIDPAPYQAAHDSAKANYLKSVANLKTIQYKFNRYKELIILGGISKQEYDDSEANFFQANADVEIAKAAVEVAKINLEYTKVLAPIDGRIGKSAVTIGALVNTNQQNSLTSITALDPIYVDISQKIESLQHIKQAFADRKQVEVTLFLQNNVEYAEKGILQFHDITVDPTTNSVQARALFSNKNEELMPGMFVRSKINIKLDNVILVPQNAVTHDINGKAKIWIISPENKVSNIEIKIKRSIGNSWLVSEGLNNGDRIVTEGMQKISQGMLVNPSGETIDTSKKTNLLGE